MDVLRCVKETDWLIAGSLSSSAMPISLLDKDGSRILKASAGLPLIKVADSAAVSNSDV